MHRLLEQYSPRVSVRILTSLADGEATLDAGDLLLAVLGAVPWEIRLIAGTSGFRVTYELPSGWQLMVKPIRSLRLSDKCPGCRFNNVDGQEGYASTVSS